MICVFSFPVDIGPITNISTTRSDSDSSSDLDSDSLVGKLRKLTLQQELLEKVKGSKDSSDDDDDDGNVDGVRSQDNDNYVA